MAESSIAVVAEKPSVARDIARVLGASKRGEGYLHGDGYVVTWAIGHLVALAQPHEIRPEWRSWSRSLLPMLPGEWPLVVGEQTQQQFEVVRRILTSPRISAVICATDSGREGELIFRYIYEAAQCAKSVQRLWISSLTPEAIREGFAKLRDWSHYDPLADAARGRSRADWLVGMNLSRAYTLACDEEFSVGRVQTPTLAMLVQREQEIRQFVPEDYRNVSATFSPAQGSGQDRYEGIWFRTGVEPLDTAKRLPADGKEAAEIVERVRSGAAEIEKIAAEQRRMAPPLLYDLTELQRHGNRLYGFSAHRVLEIAQALYERHKLLSYPRTDSRHLSQDVARTLPKVVAAIAGPYAEKLAEGTGKRPLGPRFVDDAKVSDHHAIIPTGASVANSDLDADERKIFDLVCRRLLAAWHAEHIWSITTVITRVQSTAEDRFHSSGTAVQQPGWKVLDIAGGAARDEAPVLPSNLAEGQRQKVLDVKAESKKTRPPKRLTDATLLTAMETAGKTLEDQELSDAMKESGLGTPATRAQIIEVLLKRGFIVRRGKSIEATDRGIRLIEVVHPEVKSPAMTGQWEANLKRIERGQAQLAPFLAGIEQYVRDVVGRIPVVSKAANDLPGQRPLDRTPPKPVLEAAKRTGTLAEVLRECFGFDSFRPNQEEVCRTVSAGHDVVLVMPTGSGKSLCYQLPGIMSGGTTLVISPLIALMEDQVAKLESLGLRAERIHSHRSREATREVRRQYLEGSLDFLFIAPERLRVREFPEMLAARKPSLVAIDEAHCISQWGHDFRPDYRTIGQHLPSLRPAPVIALTATATTVVQRDIAAQLGLHAPRHLIHGFRRENLAIEVVEVPPAGRFALSRTLLHDAARRPAIIYTPRRRDAEALARELQADFSVAAYHAGLDPQTRENVQRDFLGGSLEVIVATIAFGMGVDKADIRTVIHTALPGSIEGYYQEIGRAGRDGKPSRAILMFSYADRFTHDFFFERDYPDPSVLEKIFDRLTPVAQPKEAVSSRTTLGADAFDVAMEKLWIHGGAVLDSAENLSRGRADWRASYLAQRDHKAAQFEKMLAFCGVASCRMLALVRYFGDSEDSAAACGVCDFCRPSEVLAQSFREATAADQAHMGRMLEFLKGHDGIALGRLHTQLFTEASLSRRGFEELVGAMARGGLVEISATSFEKDGKRIEFRKARITRAGAEPGAEKNVQIPEEISAKSAGRGGKKKRKGAAVGKTKTVPAGRSGVKSRGNGSPQLETALKAWRLAEAKKKGVPAFRILTDKALYSLASKRPRNKKELLEISGIGLGTVDKYSAQLFRILAGV